MVYINLNIHLGKTCCCLQCHYVSVVNDLNHTGRDCIDIPRDLKFSTWKYWAQVNQIQIWNFWRWRMTKMFPHYARPFFSSLREIMTCFTKMSFKKIHTNNTRTLIAHSAADEVCVWNSKLIKKWLFERIGSNNIGCVSHSSDSTCTEKRRCSSRYKNNCTKSTPSTLRYRSTKRFTFTNQAN